MSNPFLLEYPDFELRSNEAELLIAGIRYLGQTLVQEAAKNVRPELLGSFPAEQIGITYVKLADRVGVLLEQESAVSREEFLTVQDDVLREGMESVGLEPTELRDAPQKTRTKATRMGVPLDDMVAARSTTGAWGFFAHFIKMQVREIVVEVVEAKRQGKATMEALKQKYSSPGHGPRQVG